jgi:ParB family chromosome partitioning protein
LRIAFELPVTIFVGGRIGQYAGFINRQYNRRKRACEIAEFATMPVIIRNLTNEEAVVEMVDDNLEQREKILPSEKAWAYRVKLEALNHNGIKAEQHSIDILAEQTGETKTQIYRVVHLTELVPALLDKVDAKKLAFNPAVELSYLTRTEQNAVVDAMANHEVKPSLSQAVRLKKASQAGTLTVGEIDVVRRGLVAEDLSTKTSVLPADHPKSGTA